MDMNRLALRRYLWSSVGADIRCRCGDAGHALVRRPQLTPGLMALAYPSVVREQRATLSGQRTVATDRDLDELAESNPYYAKYYDKLSALKATDPQKFEALLKSKGGGAAAAAATEERSAAAQSSPAVGLPQRSANRSVGLRPDAAQAAEVGGDGGSARALSSVLRIELMAGKTADEITDIWNAYHSAKSGLYCVLPASVYDAMHARARKCPTFVYPVPRGQGLEFFIGQWQGNACCFSPLATFQAYGENAPVTVSVVYYTELSESKGIALVSGEVDASMLPLHLAQLLVHQLHAFYGNEGNYKLVESMQDNPKDFRHEDVIAACKKCSLL